MFSAQARHPLNGPFALQMQLQGPPNLQGVMRGAMGQIGQVNAQNAQADREQRAQQQRMQLLQMLLGR